MQAKKPYISTGCATFSPSFRHKSPLWWNHPTPSWSTNQPIGDKKSAHVTYVSYPVFLLSMRWEIWEITTCYTSSNQLLGRNIYRNSPGQTYRSDINKHGQWWVDRFGVYRFSQRFWWIDLELLLSCLSTGFFPLPSLGLNRTCLRESIFYFMES